LRYVVAWSRHFADTELLCAINTDATRPLTVWITVDSRLNPPGRLMECLFSTAEEQKGALAEVRPQNGAAVQVTVPPAGFVIYR
jgi:hypothetical protein